MYLFFACLVALNSPFFQALRTENTAPPAHQAIEKNASLVALPEASPEPARIQFEDSLVHLYNAMNLSDYDVNYAAFRYGMIGYNTLQQQGKLGDKQLLTIIDFTKPSTEKRFYTLDLKTHRVTYCTYVSHGKNSGENKATNFSNVVHSNQSSLGFYTTAETYVGSKGYSLKLDGLEKGYNDNARERAVVIHAAEYVSESWIKKYGRLGRSQGCPALPLGLSKKIIETIKHNTLIFAYFDDAQYLQSSSYLNPDAVIAHSVETSAERAGE